MFKRCKFCITYVHVTLCERYFHACFIFRQPSAGQHGTDYKFQTAVPEDMWASMNGVCEDNTPLPILTIYFKYLGNVFSTRLLGGVVVAAMELVVRSVFYTR